MIIADSHYLTSMNSKADINRIIPNTYVMIKDAVAMGVSISKTKIYLQSQIELLPKISQIFQNYITLGDATSILSYRLNTKAGDGSNGNVGLVCYPIMEAADVFSVSADRVMVGKDNVEHIQMAQKLINFLNNDFGGSFSIPEYVTDSRRNYIRGIDGNQKMSKSLGNVIYIAESEESIYYKIKTMKWNNQPSDNLVLEYLKAISPEQYCDLNNFDYDEFYLKEKLIDEIEKVWAPMRSRASNFTLDDEDILDILRDGVNIVNEKARQRYIELSETLGLPKL